MKEIDEMIEKLMDMDIVRDNNTVIFSDEATQLIHEIANKCNIIPLIEKTKEQADDYAKELSAEQVYLDMLVKIVVAPTTLHMKMSAKLLIPIISRKLKERGI